MSSSQMNAGEKGEQETRPTGRAAQILDVAKTLAELGDIINYSATKVDFKGFRAASFRDRLITSSKTRSRNDVYFASLVKITYK